MDSTPYFYYLATQNWLLAVVLLLAGTGWWLFLQYPVGQRTEPKFRLFVIVSSLIVAPFATHAAGALLYRLSFLVGMTELGDYIRILTLFAVYLVIFWVAGSLAVFLINLRLGEEEGHRLSRLLVNLIRLVCIVIGLLFAGLHLDYPITGVWVSTGVVVAVVGFAMQRTLGDLLSGIALSVDQPFKINDWLELDDGTFGQVIDMNWRATRIRGWDNATHVIPNGELANQKFRNYFGSRHRYSPWYEFHITAEVDPHFVKSLLLEAVLRCENVLKNPLPVVRLSNAQSVPYTYMVWVHFRNYLAMFSGREELFQEIHYALRGAGISISPEIREVSIRKGASVSLQLPSIKLALRSMDTEGKFSEEELDEIAEASQRLTFSSGKVILDQGEVSKGIDVILSGLVESSLETQRGQWQALEQLSAGDLFGIVSMMTSEPSKFRFTALTEAQIIRTEIECVRNLAERRPEVAQVLAQIVDRRLKSASTVMASTGSKNHQLTFGEILKKVRHALS